MCSSLPAFHRRNLAGGEVPLLEREDVMQIPFTFCTIVVTVATASAFWLGGTADAQTTPTRVLPIVTPDQLTPGVIVEGEGAPPVRSRIALPGSKLIGLQVRDKAGEIGKVWDFIVDETGRIAYVFVDWRGAQRAAGSVTIPFDALQFEPQRVPTYATIVVPAVGLHRAPAFEREHWPDLANPKVLREIDDYWLGSVSTRSGVGGTGNFGGSGSTAGPGRPSTIFDRGNNAGSIGIGTSRSERVPVGSP
jgi:hypothetical protein